MRKISKLLVTALALGFVRITAFYIDLIVAWIPIALGWLLINVVLGWAPSFWAFSAIAFACALGFTEAARDGQTPGKFLFRIRASEQAQESGVRFYSSFLRLAFLFLWISVLQLLVEIIDRWFELQGTGLSGTLTIAWIVLFGAYPFLRSRGQMALHDVVAGTRVDWMQPNDLVITPAKIRRELWFCIIFVVGAHIGILAVAKERLEDVKHDLGTRGVPSTIEAMEDAMLPLSFSTPQIGEGVDNMFEYYDDLHGYIGSPPLGLLERTIKISRRGLSIDRASSVPVPVFQVFVTLQGLVSTRFQEQVAENISKLARDASGSNDVVVEFVYRGTLLELVFPLIVRRVFVRAAPAGSEDTAQRASIVTPENSVTLTIGNHEMPDFMVGTASMRELTAE